MHNNKYNHRESEPEYKHLAAQIAYRCGFELVHQDDTVFAVKDGIRTEIASGHPLNTVWFRSWKLLKQQHDV